MSIFSVKCDRIFMNGGTDAETNFRTCRFVHVRLTACRSSTGSTRWLRLRAASQADRMGQSVGTSRARTPLRGDCRDTRTPASTVATHPRAPATKLADPILTCTTSAVVCLTADSEDSWKQHNP
jgi:hypothetical protein